MSAYVARMSTDQTADMGNGTPLKLDTDNGETAIASLSAFEVTIAAAGLYYIKIGCAASLNASVVVNELRDGAGNEVFDVHNQILQILVTDDQSTDFSEVDPVGSIFDLPAGQVLRIQRTSTTTSINRYYFQNCFMLIQPLSVEYAQPLQLDFTTTTQPAQLDTYARASACAPITGSGASGVEVTKFASGEYAYAYAADFSHTSKIGMLQEEAATNILPYSEEFDNAAWSKTSCTVNANAVTAPDGTATADEIVYSAAGNIADGVGIAASTPAVLSVFMKVASGTASIRLLDAQAGALDTYTVTDQWQRFELAYTSAGSATASARIESLSAQTIHAWGMQLETGVTVATSYIPTSGASASRVETTWQVSDLVARGYIDHSQGEMRGTYVARSLDAANRWSVFIENAGGNNDDKRLVANTGNGSRLYRGDGALIFAQVLGDPTVGTETTDALQWHFDAALSGPASIRMLRDGVEVGSPTATAFVEGTSACDLVYRPSCAYVMSFLRLFLQPQEDSGFDVGFDEGFGV
jgi:hypothetical protein